MDRFLSLKGRFEIDGQRFVLSTVGFKGSSTEIVAGLLPPFETMLFAVNEKGYTDYNDLYCERTTVKRRRFDGTESCSKRLKAERSSGRRATENEGVGSQHAGYYGWNLDNYSDDWDSVFDRRYAADAFLEFVCGLKEVEESEVYIL